VGFIHLAIDVKKLPSRELARHLFDSKGLDHDAQTRIRNELLRRSGLF